MKTLNRITNNRNLLKNLLGLFGIMYRNFSNMFFWFGIQLFDSRLKEYGGFNHFIAGKIFKWKYCYLSLLHFVNNGVLNGYTKVMNITMTAITIVLHLVVCKFCMAHNGCGVIKLEYLIGEINRILKEKYGLFF